MNKKCDVREKNEQVTKLGKFSHSGFKLLPFTNTLNKHKPTQM